jgi:hypothetical protein
MMVKILEFRWARMLVYYIIYDYGHNYGPIQDDCSAKSKQTYVYMKILEKLFSIKSQPTQQKFSNRNRGRTR